MDPKHSVIKGLPCIYKPGIHLQICYAALTPRWIWSQMVLRMQFATNSQWSQGDRQTFIGVRKHSRSFTVCHEY